MRHSFQQKILSLINQTGFGVSPSDLSEKLNISRQAVHRHLKALEQGGQILRRGSGPVSKYYAATGGQTPDLTFLEVLKRFFESVEGVAAASLFGSVAKGCAGPDSDIDVLVWLKPGAALTRQGLWSAWDSFASQLEWANKVSLVTMRLKSQIPIHTLLLDMPEEHIAVYDSGQIIPALKAAVVAWREYYGARKVESFGGTHGWEYTDRKMRLEDLDFVLRLNDVA